jgi:glutathionylspermidine amidase/synthetase
MATSNLCGSKESHQTYWSCDVIGYPSMLCFTLKISKMMAVTPESGILKGFSVSKVINTHQQLYVDHLEQELRMSQKVAFGEICGYAPGDIPAFSCDYRSLSLRSIYNMGFSLFSHQHPDGMYYGFRYQCVEFARRWLIHARGVTFDSVGMAHEIFELPSAISVPHGHLIPWTNLLNGSSIRPQKGAVLIWEDHGDFSRTGHVAIVVDVSDDWVRVAEQNVEDTTWSGRNWARELQVDYDHSKGSYFIHERWGKQGGKILGWKNLPEDFAHEPLPHPT